MKKEHPLSAKREDFKHDKTTWSHDDLELIQEQSIAFLFRFRSAYAEMATGTHLQNWLKKELQIGFEEEEIEE